MSSTSGLICSTELTLGPFRSIAAMRARYLSTSSLEVSWPELRRACSSAMVTSIRSLGPGSANLSAPACAGAGTLARPAPATVAAVAAPALRKARRLIPSGGLPCMVHPPPCGAAQTAAPLTKRAQPSAIRRRCHTRPFPPRGHAVHLISHWSRVVAPGEEATARLLDDMEGGVAVGACLQPSIRTFAGE